MEKSKIRAMLLISLVILILSFITGCTLPLKTISRIPSANGSSNNVFPNNQSDTNGSENESSIGYSVGTSIVKIVETSYGSKRITVAIPVTNISNTDLYLDTASIDIENSNGTLEDVLEYVSAKPDIIRPGETTYFFEETAYDGNETDNLDAVLHVEIKKSKNECLRYDASDVTVRDRSYFGIDILGRVTNNTGKDGDLVTVVANLYNSNDEIIGQEFTYLTEDLKAGQTRAFEISSLLSDISSSDVAKTEIIAYPTQYQF